MRALVTGATGFVGSHLAAELVNRGFEVTCLIRKSSPLEWLEGLDVKFAAGDCCDPASLNDAIKDAEYVFHLAGLTKAKDERDFYRVNAEGTKYLLSACLESDALKKFVLVSSQAAGGPSMEGRPVIEEDPANPVSHYGKSKLMAEEAALASAAKGLPVVIMRPSAVYGPRDRDFFLLFKYIKKGLFPFWGESRYSLIYVDDLSRGLIMAAISPKKDGEIFYLSDSKVYTNTEIASVLGEIFSRKPVMIPIPRFVLPVAAGISGLLKRDSHIVNKDKLTEIGYKDWTCDPSKAGRELGFSAKIKLREGIKWTADWYRIHQWL